MYPIIFLNDVDLDELKKYLELRIADWIKDYTFTPKVSVEVYRVKLDDFVNKKGLAYNFQGHNLPVKCCEEEFHWEQFIFCDLLPECPIGSSFNGVVTTVKKSFYKEVFSISDGAENEPNFMRSIDAYLQIRISGIDIGVINFYASHFFFALMIGRTSNALVNNSELMTRESSSIGVKVPVKFSLDFGDISFENLLKLDVGTIFTSKVELRNTFTMSLCDTPVARVSMGKKSENIAFLLKGK